jgi:coenzyme F420-reducing hydrogenase gamma subunit
MDGQIGGKKLVVGWFTFTCSEDSTILLTELLNDHFFEWKKLVEFRHMKTLKTNNRLEGLDVAFIEGAISGKKQEEEVKRIRENAKYVVAIGACACTGQPSASRNYLLSEELNYKLYWYFSHFDYTKEVRKLSDVIKVDDQVNGCPMNVEVFKSTLGRYLKIFGIV